MYTNDYFELMDKISLVINYLDNALLTEPRIVNFVVVNKDYEMEFGLKKDSGMQLLLSIRKADEESLKAVYSSIMDYFANHEIGATMERKDEQVLWNLAPVLADKILIEFVSRDPEDQKWFYEELVKSTQKERGLN